MQNRFITYSGISSNPVPYLPVEAVGFINKCFQDDVTISFIELAHEACGGYKVVAVKALLSYATPFYGGFNLGRWTNYVSSDQIDIASSSLQQYQIQENTKFQKCNCCNSDSLALGARHMSKYRG